MEENCGTKKRAQDGIKRHHNEMKKEMGNKRKNCKKIKNACVNLKLFLEIMKDLNLQKVEAVL